MSSLKLKIVLDKERLVEAAEEWLAKRGIHSANIKVEWMTKPTLHAEIECELDEEPSKEPPPVTEVTAPAPAVKKKPHVPVDSHDIDTDLTEIIGRSRALMNKESREDPRKEEK